MLQEPSPPRVAGTAGAAAAHSERFTGSCPFEPAWLEGVNRKSISTDTVIMN